MIRDIDIDEHGNAPNCDLHRATNDRAKWNNHANVDKKLVWGPNGSPFGESDDIIVPAHGNITSGEITTPQPAPARFPYEIRAARAAAEPAADPQLIVH